MIIRFRHKGLERLFASGENTLRVSAQQAKALAPPAGVARDRHEPAEHVNIPGYQLHPFERSLRLCDPEVATANSSWELTGGLSSKEKPRSLLLCGAWL